MGYEDAGSTNEEVARVGDNLADVADELGTLNGTMRDVLDVLMLLLLNTSRWSDIPPARRVELAKKLCEGTSARVEG